MARNRFWANTIAVLSAFLLPILALFGLLNLVENEGFVPLLAILFGLLLSGFALGFFVYLPDFRKVLKFFGITIGVIGTGSGSYAIIVSALSDDMCAGLGVALGLIIIVATGGAILLIIGGALLGKKVGRSLWDDPDDFVSNVSDDDYGYLSK